MASIWDWSKVPASNGTADPQCPWPEGMARKLVNDSARGTLARIAELRDDMGGALSAGGTANGLLITPNSNVAALADGLFFSFRATATNTGAATLTYNGLAAKAIRKAGASADVALDPGDLVSGGIYDVKYSAAANGAAGAWVLMNVPKAIGPTLQTFSTPGAFTWNRPPGCKRIILPGVGGGGGGGGINGTTNTGRGSGGGASGFYGVVGPLDVTSVSSFSGTIGAAGTAGVGAGNVPGGNGGNTSCTINGTTYTWGGGGGAPSPNSSPGGGVQRGGTPGTGSNVIGYSQPGGFGGWWWDTAVASGNAQGGYGGSSGFGTGGLAGNVVAAGADTAIVGPAGFGAGGQGRGMINLATTVNGVAGTAGLLQVWEYY